MNFSYFSLVLNIYHFSRFYRSFFNFICSIVSPFFTIPSRLWHVYLSRLVNSISHLLSSLCLYCCLRINPCLILREPPFNFRHSSYSCHTFIFSFNHSSITSVSLARKFKLLRLHFETSGFISGNNCMAKSFKYIIRCEKSYDMWNRCVVSGDLSITINTRVNRLG